MRNSHLKLMFIANGMARDQNAFAGTYNGLLSALEKQTRQSIHAVDVEVRGVRRYHSVIQSFNVSPPRWKQDLRLAESSYRNRSAIANEAIKTSQRNLDFILQIGGHFSCHGSSRIPVFSYHDNISILSKLIARRSLNYFATPKVQNRFIELEKESLLQNHGIFTFSERLKNAMVQHYGIPEEKILTVGCGLNIDKSHINSNPGDEKYRSKNILFIGQDFEQKGGHDVLRAFKLVRKREPAAQLHIVGCNPGIRSDNVTVHGVVNRNTKAGREKIRQLYQSAAVFTMPSRFEPFGIPHCEAMYHSTACVGSNAGAIPEIIDDGNTGIICNIGDIEALSDAYLSIISDGEYAKYLGINGYIKARANFGWDIVAGKMLKFISNKLSADLSTQQVRTLTDAIDTAMNKSQFSAANV